MAWQQPQLADPPMVSDEIGRIQHRLLFAFPKASKANEHGVRESRVFDAATRDALIDFAKYCNEHEGTTFQTAQDGIAWYDIKVRLGVVKVGPPAPVEPPGTIYGCPGTWGTWQVGPQAIVMFHSDQRKYRGQGVGSNTSAFLNPDPQHSYVEARNEQTAELLRLALPDPKPKVFVGYSLGADSVVRALLAWPEHRRDEIAGVITFGSPGRAPGRTKLGNDPGGAGISGVYTPEWARDREWSYTIPGDWYPNARGLLPELYEILTHMELSLEFASFLWGKLTSSFGPALLGLAVSMLPGAGALASLIGLVTTGSPASAGTNILNPFQLLMRLPEIIMLLVDALKFIGSQAHSHYWVDKVFDGLTAEQHAVRVVNGLQLAA